MSSFVKQNDLLLTFLYGMSSRKTEGEKKINIMYSNCLKRKHYQIVKIYNNILNVELYTTFTLKKLKSPNFL